MCFFTREDICKCGYSKTDHVDEAIKPEDFTGDSWNIHRHVREVPTDAFGDIRFNGLGQKTGKVKQSLINVSNITLSACKHVPCMSIYLPSHLCLYLGHSAESVPFPS